MRREALHGRVCIVGVGETSYTRRGDTTTVVAALRAIEAACADAGLDPREIDAIFPPYGAHESATTEDVMANLGLRAVHSCAVFYMGGAGAVASLKTAVMALATGVARAAVLFRARRGASGRRATGRAQAVLPGGAFRRDFELPYGWTSPVHWYAMVARRHMLEYGTTREQLGEVALAMRAHAQMNPKAMMFGRPLTMADYLEARPIADPYHLYDCSLETDGATAVVLTTADRARDLAKPPVYVAGVGEGHPESPDDLVNRHDFFASGIPDATEGAYRMAGCGPADIDAAMIYDCFTFEVLHQLEDAGFCARGEGGPFVESGAIRLGGRLPVNTHGGLLSEAHMSGMNHLVEATRQLRGECGERQVIGAERVLVLGWGDLGDGSAAVLTSSE